MDKARMSRLRLSKFGIPLIGFGMLLGLAAILLFVNSSQKISKVPPGGLTAESAPSSSRPSNQAVASYNVPLANPKFINIPAIGVGKTRIKLLSLLSSGSIAAPDNIYDAGWYSDSAKPGQHGAMFIYGHVSSWTANGVFYDLKKLKTGDLITVTRGDDEPFTYQVVGSKTYPYNNVDMHQVLSPLGTATTGLNLMTCTGHIIKGTSEFDQRLVVFAVLHSPEQ